MDRSAFSLPPWWHVKSGDTCVGHVIERGRFTQWHLNCRKCAGVPRTTTPLLFAVAA